MEARDLEPVYEGPPKSAEAEATRKKVGDFTVMPISLLSRRDLTMGAKMVVAGVFYAQSRFDVQGDLTTIISELCGIPTAKSLGYLVELQNAGVLKRKIKGTS